MNAYSLLWLIACLQLSPAVVFAGAYKWQDSSGRTHYGNKPPENVSDFSEVPLNECLTEKCKAEQAAETAAQEKRHKNLTEQHLEKDKIKAQQIPKSNPVYVPIVVPTPFPIPYGGTVYSGSDSRRKRLHPKPVQLPHGGSSKSHHGRDRQSSQKRESGGSMKVLTK
ncbi:DUF4124 domain-containing protein [Pseudomonadota bacterium]